MSTVPDLMPVLSAGKHRSPRSGGCFMELAGFLAGERWSDHPKCTDPTLGELARCVNDLFPDEARSRLALLIPSVIGTGRRDRTERTRIGALVVRDCSMLALPLVTSKTRTLACALLAAERVLGTSTAEATAVLATQPEAWEFAVRCLGEHPRGGLVPRTYLSEAVPQAVRFAVQTVSDELGPDAPDVLVTMLATAIRTTRAACGLGDGDPVSDLQWQSACDLVGVAPAGRRQRPRA